MWYKPEKWTFKVGGRLAREPYVRKKYNVRMRLLAGLQKSYSHRKNFYPGNIVHSGGSQSKFSSVWKYWMSYCINVYTEWSGIIKWWDLSKLCTQSVDFHSKNYCFLCKDSICFLHLSAKLISLILALLLLLSLEGQPCDGHCYMWVTPVAIFHCQTFMWNWWGRKVIIRFTEVVVGI